MSKQHLFLVAFLPFLYLLQPTASRSGHCEQYTEDTCKTHAAFVPGHSYLGEGVDITTLEGKRAYVVDTNRWQRPNGTCTLCRNPLMDGRLQKLPLAVVDWRAHGDCRRQVSSTLEYSDVDVANVVATMVKNDWKIDLGLDPEAKYGQEIGQWLPKARVAFAGSQSQMTLFAHEKSRHDSHFFFKQEVSCEFYSLRLPQNPSLLAFHFSEAVDKLPRKHDPEEYQHFIDIYGTHYIRQVQLGGRVTHLTALQTCARAWKDLSYSRIKECFSWEVSLGDKRLPGSGSPSSNCEELWRGGARGNFYSSHTMQRTDVVGGDKQVEMLFSERGEVLRFSEWMESAKAKAGLVSYSVVPLHTLLERGDPRRDLLKQAIVTHIKRRALIRDCPQNCPHWRSWSSQAHCTCMCRPNSITNRRCCAREGKARLKFHISRGSDLWGDNFSGTDAFVKVFFQGRGQQTRVISGTNDPWWDEILDFGTVTLSDYNRFEVEIWDEDDWHNDDLLKRCWGELEAGADSGWLKCRPPYGYVELSYSLECGHTMGGPTCHDYVPLQQPTSYFNDTTPAFKVSSSSRQYWDLLKLLMDDL